MAVVLTGVVALSFAVPAEAATSAITARVTMVRPMTGGIDCPVTQPTVCLDPAPGNDAVVRVVVPTHFTSISTVCLTFHFAGDLVDPGEGFVYLDGGGFFNVGTIPLSQRTSCLDVAFQPAETAMFLDGHEAFDAWMFNGSAHLSSVDVTVVGVPR